MATGMPDHHLSRHPSLPICEGISCPATSDIPRWLCIPCSSTYCDICWDRQGPHKPGKVTLDPHPHEKTNRNVYDQLQIVFNPLASSESLEDRTATLWFGAKPSRSVEQSSHEACFETQRFTALQTQSSGRARFLVSFLGQAGSGTSTIVRLLLTSTRAGTLRGVPLQETSEYDALSGVHLYAAPAEPECFRLLYADCKGLVGPDATVDVTANNSPAQSPRPTRRRFSSIFSSVPKEPSRSNVELPPSSPQWIMSNIYSHLMYAVSDVVILVISHKRALDITTLIWLLELASKSLDFSFEQILLPRAIVALTGSSQNAEEWDDVEKETTNFLSDLNIYRDDPRLAKYLSRFKKQSKSVSSVADLLNRHYSIIRVVRIPRKERLTLLQKQAIVLQSEIQRACAAALKYENSIEEVKTAAQLHSLVKEAFNHFTTRPGQFFTRVPLDFRVDPVTPDFKHHIVTLANAVSGRYAAGVCLSDFRIFLAIAPVIASCIFTHCVRYNRPGSPANVFSQVFAPSCASALQMFIRQYTTCQYQSQQQNSTLQCTMRKVDHVMDHRMSDDTMRPGKFIPPASFVSSTWLNAIMENLVTIEDHMRTVTKPSSICNNRTPDFFTQAYALHRKKLGRFFEGFLVSVDSRFSCLGCLMNIAQYPLSCGHFLCIDCVKVFGSMSEPGIFLLDNCPLDANYMTSFKPCSVKVGSETTSDMPLERGSVQLSMSGGGPGEP